MTRAIELAWASWALAGRQNGPRHWRDRWRWLARRWAFAWVGFAVGVCGVVGWQFHVLEDLWATESQVQDLQAQLLAWPGQRTPTPSASAPVPAASGPPQAMALWPAPGTQAAVWPQLQRTLSQHGMALLSLRPQATQTMGTWPSQAVAVRMRGRFDDWVAAWAALNARGPVWGIERLRITPQEGGVDIDAVLRLWLKPSSAAASTPSSGEVVDFPEALGRISAPWRSAAGAAVFVPTHAAIPTAADATPTALAQAGALKAAGQVPSRQKAVAQSGVGGPETQADVRLASPVSPDPAHWPLDQVRLAGVWQQGHDTQLILMAGPHWVHARLGQPIGPHGHVVHRIHAQEVHLRAARGPVQVIGLEKAKP